MVKVKEKLSFKNKGSICVYSTGMTTERAITILRGRLGSVEKEMALYEYFYNKYLQLKKRRVNLLDWISYFESHPDFFTDEKYLVNNAEERENKN